MLRLSLSSALLRASSPLRSSLPPSSSARSRLSTLSPSLLPRTTVLLAPVAGALASSAGLLTLAFCDTFYDRPSTPPPFVPDPLPSSFSSSSSKDSSSRLLRNLRSLKIALLSLLRALHIFLRLSPLAILAPLSALPLPSFLLLDPSWSYFTYSLQSLGPAFVKFAQWAATRRDLFPKDFCDRLSVLHSRARRHSWPHTAKTLSSSLGPAAAADLSLSSSSRVLGSGCVAQVYLGKKNGTNVAVKVIHPSVRRQIDQDLALMKLTASLLSSLPVKGIEWMALPEAVDEFSNIMRNQIDLRKEAANLRKFRKNFGWNTDVDFPEPLLESRDVLVESYSGGHEIGAFFTADKAARKALARPLLRTFLKMVFSHNFVHCDLHPGNVLVTRSEAGEFKLTVIDAGIATELGEVDRENLRDLFLAVVTNEGERAGR